MDSLRDYGFVRLQLLIEMAQIQLGITVNNNNNKKTDTATQ